MLIEPATFQRLVRARAMLEREGAPSVNEVAKAVRISPFHFIRQFSALFGETPGKYRTRAKIERAKALLAAKRSVTDVCFEVGFASVGSFSTRFARDVGTPPSKFEPVISDFSCVGMLGAIPEKRRAGG